MSQVLKLLKQGVEELKSQALALGAGGDAAASPEALVALRAQVFSLAGHNRRKASVALHESVLSTALRRSKEDHILDSAEELASLDGGSGGGGGGSGNSGEVPFGRRPTRLPPISGVGRLNVFAVEQAIVTGVYDNGDPVKAAHIVSQVLGLLPVCSSGVRLRLVVLYCVAFEGMGPEAAAIMSQLTIVEKVGQFPSMSLFGSCLRWYSFITVSCWCEV
jgi:hypothetical protein